MQLSPSAQKLLQKSLTTARAAQHRGAPAPAVKTAPPPKVPSRKPGPATAEDRPVTIAFTIREGDGPALRSAIDEIRQKVGQRLEVPHLFAKEHALTNAAIALAALAAELNARFVEDPHYA